MNNKFISILLLTALMTSFVPVKAEIEDIHIPVISTPIGAVKGAAWGTRAFAGALGDEDHPLNVGLGLVIGAPIGFAAGAISGFLGGPFSDKK